MVERTGVLVVGAGPQALTMVAYLVRHGVRRPEEIVVVDPAGSWLRAWEARFRAHRIDRLRSPTVHHPDPDPYALGRFLDEHELTTNDGLPVAAGFASFCRAVSAESGVAVRRDTVIRLAVVGGVARALTGSGVTIEADEVVVATNHGVPRRPGWAGARPVLHASEIDLSNRRAPSRVLVVGGGLTAGQLACAACDDGATVTLVHRGRLRAQRFDADPGWLGPKLLRPFWRERDPARRAAAVARARRPSLTPGFRQRISSLAAAGALTVRESEVVAHVEDDGSVVLGSGVTVECDEIWCATGRSLDASSDPIVGPLLVDRAATFDGLPDLDAGLRVPGAPVRVVGALAALRLGPFAGNLVGARMAAQLVVDEALKPPPARLDRTGHGRSAYRARARRRRASVGSRR